MAARKKAKRAGRKASARGSQESSFDLASLRHELGALNRQVGRLVQMAESVAPLLEQYLQGISATSVSEGNGHSAEHDQDAAAE